MIKNRKAKGKTRSKISAQISAHSFIFLKNKNREKFNRFISKFVTSCRVITTKQANI